ncbi:MAG: MBOAT family protein [Hyphomicrobium sp.]|nr:MBOAT family protein [Hyphomicrobium sp.]
MVLPLAIAVNLLAIGFFKYSFFITSNLAVVVGHGIEENFRNIWLPIGISFFTFQSISYLVDVSRREVVPPRNPLVFLTFVSFFPHLIAGPIVRYSVVCRYFLDPKWTSGDVFHGTVRFLHGLGKKLIVADTAGAVADACFALQPGELGFSAAWIGAVAYTIQIYFDFSGYSDMAIGIARMFGVRFEENFRRPYSAASITDFWRRWHISLSTFFRDYVYIPLGGNSGSKSRTYLNLLIVFFLTGVWHGAAWHFIAWGLYNGLFLVAERLWRRGKPAAGRTLAGAFYVTVVVVFGWVLFRARDLSYAYEYWQTMSLFKGFSTAIPDNVAQALDPLTAATLVLSLSVFFIPGHITVGKGLEADAAARVDYVRFAYAVAVGLVASVLAFSRPFSPFLYFQF